MSRFTKRRRTFLLGGAAMGFGAYAYQRGLRFPRMGFEPRPLPQTIEHSQGTVVMSDAIAVDAEKLALRAIAPEPGLSINMIKGSCKLSINNIAPNARLQIKGRGIRNLDEQQEGITRTVKIDAAVTQQLTLDWRLPPEDGFRFAVIGDTGGNAELEWCLQRAKALDAQFLLHLGDFNYGNGDYQRAIEHFHCAPLPCYISIGNHDFNDSGLVYHRFRQQLGRFNHSFKVAGTRFVNIDTAVDFFPADAGLRGAMFDKLTRAPSSKQLFFTHRPLRDPRPGEDHNAGSHNEIAWLHAAMQAAGGGELLTGHVHHSAELEVDGIRQYSVGEGLGHEDILVKRKIAQMLIGTTQQGRSPIFNWVDLEMPWTMHNSHTHLKKLQKRGNKAAIDWFQSLHSAGD